MSDNNNTVDTTIQTIAEVITKGVDVDGKTYQFPQNVQISITIQSIIESFLALYEISEEKNFSLAMTYATINQAMYAKDPKLKLSTLQSIIQLEASGHLRPPVHLSTLYGITIDLYEKLKTFMHEINQGLQATFENQQQSQQDVIQEKDIYYYPKKELRKEKRDER